MRVEREAVSAEEGAPHGTDLVVADVAALAASMGRLLAILAAAPAFRNSGLTLSEWIALFILDRSELISSNQLAKRLGVTRQRAQQIAAGFVEAGLITMQPSPADSRKNEITVTAKGKTQLAGANVQLARFLLEKLGASQALLARTRTSVGRMVKSLEQSERAPERAA